MPSLNVIGLPRLLVSIVYIVAAALLVLFLSPTVFGTVFASAHVANTHTQDVAVRSAQQASNCMELIVNGGFEQTVAGWNSTAGASLFAYASDQFVGGRQSLLLGFTAPINITATFGVEQLLALPAESSRIELSFYYNVQVAGQVKESFEEATSDDLSDHAFVTFYDDSNNQLIAMLVLSATDGEWNMGRYDLTPLAGKTVRVGFSTQNDGEPDSLSMRVDDVSILACLPPTVTTEPLILSPQPSPTPTSLPTLLPTSPPSSQTLVPALTPALIPAATASAIVTIPIIATASVIATATAIAQQAIPQAPAIAQTETIFPQAGSIASLEACRCDSALYTCSDFSSWSVAQACYTRCQVTAGYDIHNLDEDRNGIACELELQDVSAPEATPSPQSTPSVITETTTSSPDTSASVNVVPITGISPTDPSLVGSSPQPPSDTLPVQPPAVVAPVTATNGVTTGVVTTGVTTTNTFPITAVNGVTLSAPSTVAITAAPVELAGNALLPNATPPDMPVNPATPLSAIEMLSLLLFSPLGYIALGALVIVGSLSLWVAYMVGQRGRAAKVPPAPPMDFRPPTQS